MAAGCLEQLVGGLVVLSAGTWPLAWRRAGGWGGAWALGSGLVVAGAWALGSGLVVAGAWPLGSRLVVAGAWLVAALCRRQWLP